MTHTVADVAERYGTRVQTVLSWIAGGDLKAIDISTSMTGKRPSWRITDEALADFERIRSSAPAPEPPASRRRTNDLLGDVIDRY